MLLCLKSAIPYLELHFEIPPHNVRHFLGLASNSYLVHLGLNEVHVPLGILTHLNEDGDENPVRRQKAVRGEAVEEPEDVCTNTKHEKRILITSTRGVPSFGF